MKLLVDGSLDLSDLLFEGELRMLLGVLGAATLSCRAALLMLLVHDEKWDRFNEEGRTLLVLELQEDLVTTLIGFASRLLLFDGLVFEIDFVEVPFIVFVSLEFGVDLLIQRFCTNSRVVIYQLGYASLDFFEA